ncbi:DEAD/DEAH box helicase [Oceanobacillus sp. 1P07AA]|uniref:DEAD/DEAH box helicase n=1 Tax=Oceanobacillus sp. 1P07AA TaxID=3132293 RepID=UPI0039A4DA20
MVVDNDKNNTERNILIQPYKRGFDSKEEAMQQVSNISSYLETINLWNNSKLNVISEKEFIQQLENGVPHRLGSCLESRMSLREVDKYRTNIFCFDLDHLDHLPDDSIRKIISRLNGNFHYIQESFSSGTKLTQKRFHCYLMVSTLQVDFNVLNYIYKRVKDELSVKIGIEFDGSMHLLKNIFASGKDVKVNNTLDIFNLSPYLEDYNAKRSTLSNKQDMKSSVTVNEVVDEDFNDRFTTTQVNFPELLKVLKSAKVPVYEYHEWIRYLMSFNDMERKGLITKDQKYHLAEAIDDGNASYYKEMEKLERYTKVTIGSLIYNLQLRGISTNQIFTLNERKELRIDTSFDIYGKITENQQVFKEIERVITNPENSGKRILLYSETGTGKSTAILKILEKFNDNQSKGFSILSIPRRNLINNLKTKFEKSSDSNTITGSDIYTFKERRNIINDSTNILTTVDHCPYIVKFKLEKDDTDLELNNSDVMTSYNPRLMILDECHMLSNDATFKEETIREYCAAEKNLLKSGGLSVHVTATPENLRSEDYDFIIKVNQLDRENPFQHAGYLMMEGTSKQIEKKMLETIKLATKKNRNRRLLVFIERKEIIFQYSKELNNMGIKTMQVVSSNEEIKSKDEISVVCKGEIPEDVQVILATTSLSAGVSIINNDKGDEIWVLCTSRSLNYEMTRIAQMAHRFRNPYHALKLFIQQGKSQVERKTFLYHKYLDEEVKKAENFKRTIEFMRENNCEGRVTLDDLEKKNGLFTDRDGQVSVCQPLIQSEIVLNKTYYNINNPMALINELSKKFQLQINQMKINGFIDVEENDKSMKCDPTVTSNDIISKLIKDELFYSQLNEEYILYGKSRLIASLPKIKSSTLNDLMLLFDNGYEFSFASQIMKAHLHAKKNETLSYKRDIAALKNINKIKNSAEKSLLTKVVEKISKDISLAKNQMVYQKTSEIKSYLNSVAREVLESKRYYEEPKKVEYLYKLLKIKK